MRIIKDKKRGVVKDSGIVRERERERASERKIEISSKESPYLLHCEGDSRELCFPPPPPPPPLPLLRNRLRGV